jgi:hypothetical protein
MKKVTKSQNKPFSLPERPEELSSMNDFKVPNGYFASLEEALKTKTEVLSVLTKSPSREEFEVPQNYFDELGQQINDTLRESKRSSSKEWLKILLRPQLSLSFAALLLLLWFTIKTRELKVIDLPSAYLTIEDLSKPEYLDDLDEYSLIEALATQQDKPASPTVDDPYIEYLIDHDIDISQIVNSL